MLYKTSFGSGIGIWRNNETIIPVKLSIDFVYKNLQCNVSLTIQRNYKSVKFFCKFVFAYKIYIKTIKYL